MTDTNPYAPPRETDTSVSSVEPSVAVRGPAIGLMVTSIIGLMSVSLSLLFTFIVTIAYLTQQLQMPAGVMPQMLLRSAWSLSILTSNVFILIGAVNMLGLKKYGMCRIGATLAIIPCIGPCYLLGIPFGIWAIVVLSKPEVREAFGRT